MQPAISNFSVSAIVNGASNQQGPGAVSPGEVLVIYGFSLGPATLTTGKPAANGLYPTTLVGTSVGINGILARVLYTSSGQVSTVVPFEVSGATARISVVYQGQNTPALTSNIVQATPAIFTADGSGAGQALAVNADGSVNGPSHPAPQARSLRSTRLDWDRRVLHRGPAA